MIMGNMPWLPDIGLLDKIKSALIMKAFLHGFWLEQIPTHKATLFTLSHGDRHCWMQS